MNYLHFFNNMSGDSSKKAPQVKSTENIDFCNACNDYKNSSDLALIVDKE